MAGVTNLLSFQDTTDATITTTGLFTPASNDLLVVFIGASNTVLATPTVTTSGGLTFTKITSATFGSSTHTGYLYIADSLATAVAQTLTFNCTGDGHQGVIIEISAISGMTKTGAAAAAQSAKVDNQAASGTPAVTFGATTSTNNPTIGYVYNNSNPSGMTPPSGWTERDDSGHATPNKGVEYATRDSGFAGTTITWGSTSATVFCAVVVELYTGLHTCTGDIVGPGAVAEGSAKRFVTHTCTGAIVGPGAVVAGSATHTGHVTHTCTGEIVGPGAIVAGTAAHKTIHICTGSIVGQGAVVTGLASIPSATVARISGDDAPHGIYYQDQPRKKRKKPLNRKIEETMKRFFDKEVEQETPIAEKAVEIVKEHIVESTIDWPSIENDLNSIRQLIELYNLVQQKKQQDEEELILMLMGEI